MRRDGTSLPSSDVPSPRKAKGQTANAVIRAGVSSSGKRFPRVAHDHYVEARWVSERLFEEIAFGGASATILDPAAGFGHIPRAARAAGYRAIGSDIVKRAAGVRGGQDFLSADYPRPKGRLSIVSNPPFKHLRAFTEKALELADRRVAILANQRRINAAGAWLKALPLTRVLYLTPRPSMWPGAAHAARVAAGQRMGSPTEDYAWLIFEVGGKHGWRGGWLRRDG